MENEEIYLRAKKRVDAQIGFYIHLAAYAGVNLLLIIINLTTSARHLWFIWPLIGWGIGVAFHALAVFVCPVEPSFRTRMIEKEMKKMALLRESSQKLPDTPAADKETPAPKTKPKAKPRAKAKPKAKPRTR